MFLRFINSFGKDFASQSIRYFLAAPKRQTKHKEHSKKEKHALGLISLWPMSAIGGGNLWAPFHWMSICRRLFEFAGYFISDVTQHHGLRYTPQNSISAGLLHDSSNPNVLGNLDSEKWLYFQECFKNVQPSVQTAKETFRKELCPYSPWEPRPKFQSPLNYGSKICCNILD